MKVSSLIPPPRARGVLFDYSQLHLVPDSSGCYVLSNHQEDVLYIGQAISLRNRIGQHLKSPDKTAVTRLGAAFWVHYLEAEEFQLDSIESGWNQLHQNLEGIRPIHNKINPPSA